MQTIFITGSSTGLGRATATLFAARGWRVIATMRRPDAERELAALANVHLLALDVTQPAQIAEAVKAALAIAPIDVVFNNAGYGLAGPLEGTSDAELVREIDTNLLGTIRTTQAFLPHLRERGKGTIIATTSIGGLVTFPFTSVYHATKWALEGFCESLAFELAPFGIAVKTVSPGGIKTDFAGRSLAMAQHPAYAELVGRAMKTWTDPARAAGYSTAEQIAEVVWEAATDGKSVLRYVAGADAQAAYALRKQVGDEAFRAGVAERFLK